mmetsp:Transcript_107364/g.313934  ORF Transcript_107364/g.313934 Transcript_107364/m.313934 type:complete len:382 (-) Transcript_107364:181-1326(-)
MSMSSLVHLLAVELRCVFISALSLCTFIRTIQKELLHKPEEDTTDSTLIAFFCAPTAALLLAASIYLLCSLGCKSFQSGEYLAFTSRMQAKWWYRGLVLVMIASVVTTFATAYNEVSTSIPSAEMQNQCCSFVAQVDHEQLGLQPDFSFCCGQPEMRGGLDCPPPPGMPDIVFVPVGGAGAAGGAQPDANPHHPHPFHPVVPELPNPWHIWKPALEMRDFPPLPDKWNATWVFISYKWRTGCKRVLRHPWLKPFWPRAVLLVRHVGVAFIVLLGTTAALIAPKRPSFDVTGKDFQSIVFQRPWYSVVTTSNDAFLLRLQEALFLSDVEQQVLLQSLLGGDDVQKARSIERELPKTLMNEISEEIGNTFKMTGSDSESSDSE